MTATVKQDFHNLVLACNKDGMEALRKGQSKAAFEQFKYAEAILIANQAENGTSLSAVTCNNLGCYYKKVGKLHGALSYLRRALQMEVDLNTDEVTLAGTHLNICAILSKLEKHDKAVQHAMSALELINRRISNADPKDVPMDDYSVLAIAYHNVAVERDLLQQYDKAAAAFQQGHEVAKRCLGEDHPLAITLGKNCEAVLGKSQKHTRVALSGSLTARTAAKDLDLVDFKAGLEDSSSKTLPALPGAKAADKAAQDFMPQSSVRQDAARWVESESSAWQNFAKDTLSGKAFSASHSPTSQGAYTPRGSPPLAGESLRPTQKTDLEMLKFQDTGRDIPFSTVKVPRPPIGLVGAKKTPLATAIEALPPNILDIVDAGQTGLQVAKTIRSAPNDFRPNRVIKGSTRTARVMERTSAWNTTTHRDKVMQGRQPNAVDQKNSEWRRKIAAERIQRAWRAWYKYCQENSDWLVTTWIAATMIQARWRCYHVRRLKLDKAATVIQRHMRGCLIRKALRRHRAAVTIQRHAIGGITRDQMRKLNRAAVKIQALIRGGLARRRVQNKRAHLQQTAITIQCAVRCHQARRRVQAKRHAAMTQKARIAAAIYIQRIFRGGQGRARAAQRLQEYTKDVLRYKAATKLQSMVRRDKAIKRVDRIRAEKYDRMNQAATVVRKMWLGARARKKYKDLMDEFARHVDAIVTMQRYTRGCLVRMRMWRQAARAEDELWAALEIQRVWRGYQGRVKWEAKYEEVWMREMAAVMIQRNLRGWLARTKVARVRRRIARAEFERARQRFRAAQHIQALIRGVLVRSVFSARFARARRAAVNIQRIARGHALRKRIWHQVINLRAIKIQAQARGFLVRCRRFHLVAKVICIQRHWRQWLQKPPEVRERGMALMKERKKQATIIQKKFREHSEGKELERIQADTARP
eukprot:TRINITY_DN76694_c0_g1_i1.p1 TRINITY_DN76694_c0_g1~~TRINITY_DN76694_c0_g1_i1.p1  ORF type:complete len:974 (+),score=182.93 TRINITY_DN76694_c0_g1_i1:145-2922(+)